MEFQEKFVGFVDILGFKSLVESAENGGGIDLSELMEMIKYLGSPEDSNKMKTRGGTTCPQSIYIEKDLNFIVTQISDCAIVSSEISPAGIINLVSHCWGSVLNLLNKGFMCRGYITKGLIYQTDSQVIGSGYMNALSKEPGVSAFKQEAEERGTPYVEVDPVICAYIENSNDKCVKEMFSRMVKSDGESTVLFPFQRLSHSFMVTSWDGEDFDPQKEKEANNNVRLLINRLKEQIMEFVDMSNSSAVRKSKHYIVALDVQLKACDKTDEAIEMWS